jgi:hypothetical protein
MTLFGVPLRDLILPAILLGWVLLMFVVLPKMGVPT